jgi:adenylate cyclase
VAVTVPRRATLRVVVWAFHLALPLLGLWLLLAQPQLDARWQHQGGHFVLVVAVAAVNVALGARISEVSRRRADARLFLVSLVFLSSAGFLLLHALATPGSCSAPATPGSPSPPRSACCWRPASPPSPASS